MKLWCREFVDDAIRNRVATPPCLDKVEYEGLCSVFEHFDDERQGAIMFDALVTKGLIYTEQVEEYRQLWDSDGNGVLSLDEFCEMMCPVGFRATTRSTMGSQADGKRVIYDNSICGWKLERQPMDDHESPPSPASPTSPTGKEAGSTASAAPTTKPGASVTIEPTSKESLDEELLQ